MALAEITKQLAEQALLSATREPPAPTPAPADNPGAVILNQIGAMQKALKDDEELVVHFQSAGDRIRVMEIFLPSPAVAVLIGMDNNRIPARVIATVASLQLVTRTGKVQPGAKATRVNLVVPKSKDGK